MGETKCMRNFGGEVRTVRHELSGGGGKQEMG